MLNIENITKRYGSRIIIDNLSCSFSENGVTIIVGTNGSGKTTLLNMITNLVKYDEGTIVLDNKDISELDSKKRLYYIPSDFYLPEYMTGIEYAKFILSRYPNSDTKQLKTFISLLDLEESQDKMIETYSFGIKKKIQIAVALSSNASYIILDEVFSGLDFETTVLVQELLDIISKNKKIIIVSHDRNTLEKFPNDIRLLKEGKLEKFKGSPMELYEYIKSKGVLNDKLKKLRQY